MYTIQDYLDKVAHRYKTGISTEHSYRGDLQNLLESLLPNVLVTNEPARIQCGAPDYILTKATIPIGYIEAKDIGKALDSKEYKEQFDRYRNSLDNLIITDYLEFRFYREGLPVTSIKLADITGMTLIAKPENFAPFTDLITDFSSYIGQTITSPSKLAKMMAGKAKLLAIVIEKALTSDEQSEADSTLKEQMQAFKSILIHEIEPKQFADIYAQTIAYGMFAARLHDETLDTFTRQEAAQLIPQSNPFLRKLFQYIAGYDLDDRIVWIVDSLADIFRATDVRALLTNFGKATRQTDPIIHFYETFLAEYDPKLRKSRGVWYTPEPVVDFIVRAVDDILKTDFNLPLGLADHSKTTIQVEMPVLKGKGKTKYTQLQKVDKEVHKVQILDPATGTGTFLAATIKHIHRKFKGQQGLWSQYVEDHLIPRINGFEILMASYAMAHLKLDLVLKETGYQPDKQPRLNIYLTNSLEESHPDTGTLFATWLAKESNEANHIKRDTSVMVVMGNPPYSGHSLNKGEWIEALIRTYKQEPGGGRLQEKNPKWLNDDYVKFIRYGQHYIEKNGEGILAYINNNCFLDNPTFRGMRWQILKTFDVVYIIDLHGSSKKKETAPDGSKDENVFDIQQGVSINIFVKTGKKKINELARVFHFDLYGSRGEKYQFLLDNHLESINFSELPNNAPLYFMVRKDFDIAKKYEKGFLIKDLFVLDSMGITSGNDKDLISFSNNELAKRFEDNQYISKVYYRPFDIRFVYYNQDILARARFVFMKHLNNRNNIGLAIIRRSRDNRVVSPFVARCLIDKCIISTLDNANIFPLYLYSETNARTPNLNPVVLKQIAEKLGLTFTPEKSDNGALPESLNAANNQGHILSGFTDNNTFTPIDLLDYIYAVLHSPNYRETYKEFLKIDFPRVPYPEPKTFWSLAKLGSELRQIHLLESPLLDNIITAYPNDGDNIVTRKINKNDFELVGWVDKSVPTGRVWVNDQQYFNGVPVVAWEFYIGGYQPAQKWLKDRHGRKLNFEDILHYQKIIVALTETHRLMQTIDSLWHPISNP